jgi:hypothetical protein
MRSAMVQTIVRGSPRVNAFVAAENSENNWVYVRLVPEKGACLSRGVRPVKPELDAERSGPVISGTWLPK